MPISWKGALHVIATLMYCDQENTIYPSWLSALKHWLKRPRYLKWTFVIICKSSDAYTRANCSQQQEWQRKNTYMCTSVVISSGTCTSSSGYQGGQLSIHKFVVFFDDSWAADVYIFFFLLLLTSLCLVLGLSCRHRTKQCQRACCQTSALQQHLTAPQLLSHTNHGFDWAISLQ